MDDSNYEKKLSNMFTKIFLILIVFYVFIGFLGIICNKIDKNEKSEAKDCVAAGYNVYYEGQKVELDAINIDSYDMKVSICDSKKIVYVEKKR